MSGPDESPRASPVASQETGYNSHAERASVGHLQSLYHIVVGLGLALAMAELVRPGRDPVIEWRAMPILLAYIVTLVPFYHGALRHLDEAYLHGRARGRGHAGLLLTDFGVLFLESCLLLALAAFVAKPTEFGWALAALLAVDALWGLVFVSLTDTGSTKAELKWAIVNTITIGVLASTLLITDSTDLEQLGTGLLVMAIAIARSACDYWLCWPFYFPSAAPRQ